MYVVGVIGVVGGVIGGGNVPNKARKTSNVQLQGIVFSKHACKCAYMRLKMLSSIYMVYVHTYICK